MAIKFNLSQKTANRLMTLYREMDLVPVEDFNQYDCGCCVIGHSMHNGSINGFTESYNVEQFNKAIEWVGLPKLMEFDGDNDYEFGILGDYLFGTSDGIYVAGSALDFPLFANYSPKSAQKRIKQVLKAADYEVVWNV